MIGNKGISDLKKIRVENALFLLSIIKVIANVSINVSCFELWLTKNKI